MKTNTPEILYEDTHIIVCVKPHGVPTQSRKIGMPDMSSMIKNHLHQQNASSKSKEPYLAIIHRLDQPVTGILVFAKTPFAAKELNASLQNGKFHKVYRALVEGIPPHQNEILENYMVKDIHTNTSHICGKDTPGAKLARLQYKILEKGQGIFNLGRSFSNNTPSPELEIELETGRHHQIRVQLAHIGCPIVGDTKYNLKNSPDGTWQQIQLCAYKLSFPHPKTKKLMTFQMGTGYF